MEGGGLCRRGSGEEVKNNKGCLFGGFGTVLDVVVMSNNSSLPYSSEARTSGNMDSTHASLFPNFSWLDATALSTETSIEASKIVDVVRNQRFSVWTVNTLKKVAHYFRNKYKNKYGYLPRGFSIPTRKSELIDVVARAVRGEEFMDGRAALLGNDESVRQNGLLANSGLQGFKPGFAVQDRMMLKLDMKVWKEDMDRFRGPFCSFVDMLGYSFSSEGFPGMISFSLSPTQLLKTYVFDSSSSIRGRANLFFCSENWRLSTPTSCPSF